MCRKQGGGGGTSTVHGVREEKKASKEGSKFNREKSEEQKNLERGRERELELFFWGKGKSEIGVGMNKTSQKKGTKGVSGVRNNQFSMRYQTTCKGKRRTVIKETSSVWGGRRHFTGRFRFSASWREGYWRRNWEKRPP